MKKKNYSLNYVVNHIQDLDERLCEADSNLKYIKVCKALKLWLDRFADMLSPEQAEKSPEYQAWFLKGAGFSFYNKVINSILDYEGGNRPF